MIQRRLVELCSLDGVSGREQDVRAYILRELEKSPTEKDIFVDALGNVLVCLRGRERASKTLLFDAHMDEVGFFITHIHEDGTLCFDTVGGIDTGVLYGHRVRIGEAIGVVGGKAIHHCEGEEKSTLPALHSLVIDIGAENREMAENMAPVGSWGTFASDFQERENGYFMGKAVDDRVGCALLLGLADKQPTRDIWLSFSVQEEVGLRGAKVVGERVKPDTAIVIDATTAADTVGSSDSTCVCRVGQGAVVSFSDGATLYDMELYNTIRSLATDDGIVTQTKNRVAGGNNAGAIQRSHIGVKTAAISLPCRYIHSPACVGNWDDVYALEKLLSILVERLSL